MICFKLLSPDDIVAAVIWKWETKATTSSSSAFALKKIGTSVLINAILGEKENDDLKYEAVQSRPKPQ